MTSLYKTIGRHISCVEHYVHRYSTNILPVTSYATAKRTSENNPTLHTAEHIGLFYTLPADDVNVLFKLGGFPRSFKENLNTFGETCLMIRSPAVEIINNLRKTEPNKAVVRYLLYGKPGCGKSVTLAHILHYAFTNQFIILHVPWVWDWFRSNRHEIANSEIRKGFIDLPLVSAQWLKHFQLQNNKILNELCLQTGKTYVWNQRENTPAGSNLLELVTFGINRIKYAANCVMSVVSELKALSTEGRCKTFVAVDGFNALFGNVTNLRKDDRSKVTPAMVTLTEAFLEATKQDWRNGAVVLTVDQMSATYNSLHSYLPLYLLGKAGFEHIDPFIPVSVTEYSDMELNSALDYYEDRRWLQKTGGRNELSFLTKNNPYQLMNICGPL